MTLLQQLQQPLTDAWWDAFDEAMLRNALDTEPIKDDDDRLCYCKTKNGKLACSNIKTGGLYKVDGYTMTTKPLKGDAFDRWATGFDI